MRAAVIGTWYIIHIKSKLARLMMPCLPFPATRGKRMPATAWPPFSSTLPGSNRTRAGQPVFVLSEPVSLTECVFVCWSHSQLTRPCGIPTSNSTGCLLSSNFLLTPVCVSFCFFFLKGEREGPGVCWSLCGAKYVRA
jgi:hypothetical protein